MPDKPFEQLCEVDQLVRRAKPVGMDDGVHVTFEFFTGFELFNTRPHHNYETWSGGWRVTGLDVVIEREDLDDAVREWAAQVRRGTNDAETA